MGKQANSLRDETFIASTVVAEFRAVGFDGAQATVQGQKVVGVAKHDAEVADAMAVGILGSVTIEAGAAIAIGDGLIVDANGRAIPTAGEITLDAGATAVTSTAANGAIMSGGEMPEYIFADALEVANAAGDFIEVLLRR